MAAHGMTIRPEDLIQVSGGESILGYSGAEKFLALQSRPSGLVCFNDMMAIGVLRKFQEVGIRVPEDCSVTGFDNISFSEFSNPPLTTFDQPKHFIGAEAAGLVLELLQQKYEGNGHNPVNRTLQGKLLVRQSTASPHKPGGIGK
jgi:DNA-binding LacI/PurR family transcriptional regulator